MPLRDTLGGAVPPPHFTWVLSAAGQMPFPAGLLVCSCNLGPRGCLGRGFPSGQTFPHCQP